MIWLGNISYAYIIPERYISLLDMDHLRPNGRPMFHMIKERYGMNPFDNIVCTVLSLDKSRIIIKKSCRI